MEFICFIISRLTRRYYKDAPLVEIEDESHEGEHDLPHVDH